MEYSRFLDRIHADSLHPYKIDHTGVQPWLGTSGTIVGIEGGFVGLSSGNLIYGALSIDQLPPSYARDDKWV
jgi:hypothetical protein